MALALRSTRPRRPAGGSSLSASDVWSNKRLATESALDGLIRRIANTHGRYFDVTRSIRFAGTAVDSHDDAIARTDYRHEGGALETEQLACSAVPLISSVNVGWEIVS